LQTSLIIFSKNRPLQLDLCLKSVKKNLRGSFEISVLYVCDKEFCDSYDSLKKDFPDVSFWRQGSSIFKDVYTLIASQCNPRVGFLTDDCIVYRPSIDLDVDNLLTKHSCCYSLRMGLNITKRRGVVNGELTEFPEPLSWFPGQAIFQYPHGVVYDRTQHFYGGYWNYPLSVDGHIFNSETFIEYIEELCHVEKIKQWKQTPNELEAALQRFTHIAEIHMCIPTESCVVNSPNNRVSKSFDDTENGTIYELSPQAALEMFNQGKRINLDKLDFAVNCPHTEINLMQGVKDAK